MSGPNKKLVTAVKACSCRSLPRVRTRGRDGQSLRLSAWDRYRRVLLTNLQRLDLERGFGA